MIYNRERQESETLEKLEPEKIFWLFSHSCWCYRRRLSTGVRNVIPRRWLSCNDRWLGQLYSTNTSCYHNTELQKLKLLFHKTTPQTTVSEMSQINLPLCPTFGMLACVGLAAIAGEWLCVEVRLLCWGSVGGLTEVTLPVAPPPGLGGAERLKQAQTDSQPDPLTD